LKGVCGILLTHVVDFKDSVLVETDEGMKELELVLRILGEKRTVDGEGRQSVSDAFRKLAKQRDNFHRQQDDVEGKLEAQDGIIAGLRERSEVFTTGEGIELENSWNTLTW